MTSTMDRRPPVAPGGRPAVGHTVSFLRDPLGSLERWVEAGPAVVRARVARKRVRLACTPAAAEDVLVANRGRFQKAKIVRDRLGTLQGGSLVLLDGEQWRERRRTLQKAFGPDRVAAAEGLTARYAARTVEKMPADRSFRVDERARDLSLSVLARALFDLDLRGGETPVHEAADDVLSRMDVRSVSTYLPEWVPTPTNRRFRRAAATLHDRLDEVVADRAGRDGEGGDDLLSVLSAAGLPSEVVRNELIAFLFAGFDSTATALSCTLGLLAAHPSAQERLFDALTTASLGWPPDPAAATAIPYLDAVVCEGLRLYPPQYALFREPTAPVDIAGFRVDPGDLVVVPPWTLHRDRRYWTDPDAFRPERWLDDGPDRPEFAYLPYGTGPRYCLGERLADLTLGVTVAAVCLRRRLDGTAPTVAAGPTLSLPEGVSMCAHRRDETPSR